MANNKLTATSDKFEVQVNPNELTHSRSITYDKSKALGESASEAKFDKYGDESLGFAVVLDGTGAIPAASGAVTAVADQLDAMLKVVYNYQSDKHESGYVQLVWGSLLFNGRLESLSTQYTLFSPGGVPLRAKVTLKFTGFVGTQEAALAAGKSSPDLSHEVLVRDGDTLPLLCQSIYGDGRYYAEVARFNGLSRFRFLQPGTRLHFPPLE